MKIVENLAKDKKIRKIALLMLPIDIFLAIFYILSVYITRNIFLILFGVFFILRSLLSFKLKKEVEKELRLFAVEK